MGRLTKSYVDKSGYTICERTSTSVKVQELVDKLAHYEDLEEQGRLILLPCKVGDTVYFIDRTYNRTIRKFIDFVNIGYVKAIKFSARPTKVTIEYDDGRGQGRCKGADYHASNIGKTIFLTKEEALAKLEELKEGVE